MKETVYITGHKNPDSDSICSAIAYAEYKNTLGDVNAIPVRLGNINRETDFILKYFGVKSPTLLETVKLSVEDLDFDKIAPITSDISLRMGLELMKKNTLNSIAVIDENEELIGVVTISDIIQSYIDVWDNTILGKSNTSIDNVLDTLSAKPIFISKDKKKFIGKLLVLAMKPESMEESIEKEDIVICGDRKDSQYLALEKGVSLLIITGNNEVDKEIIEKAKENNISIISTPHDTFTTSRLITQSIPIDYVSTKENLILFELDDLVDDVKVKMSQTRYRSYPVVDDKKKVVGLISRYHLISSIKKKVILVDHNERSQSVDGLEESEILEIIDHHRVADVFTGNPIYFRNEPVGSTATIIASIFFENGRRPSKKIAGILAAAIISDTLLFRSPTSTSTDKIMLKRLEKISDLDVEKFAMEMFKNGTSLTGKTPKELLKEDFKVFTINEQKIGIAQVYTMDRESLKDIKVELLRLMEERRQDKGYSTFILMLTDIFKEASEIIVVGENIEIIGKAFEKDIVNNSFYVKGVLSRKKQIVPPITIALTSIEGL
ncbi:putative manganese-dependent inorganic diphosphatase [Tissierella creatinophila]|uniref:inorganic diphosphatase n=1 Tax=Tissierella creatinophila DSM 6911 TaxID=1123403 RepID=A0A1U7M4I8_TISCR|nr:putative manganese-dependent inorganic diphosphatase [Tissierella creatinophila]OLS02227.1 cobalt-dependent inorganic pyrophosphatase [Tissierella creatinophila DSM 6911]